MGATDVFDRAVREHLAGNTGRAATLYRQALAANPRHAPSANNLGTILAVDGERSEAERKFREAVQLEPRYGEALNNLGILLSEGGEYAEASRCFASATDQEPGKAGWHNNHGNALVELFRFRDAVAAYDRAIAIDPNVPDYWSNRGIALRGLREEDAAATSLQRALDLDPGNISALNNLGIIHKEARRYADAERLFRCAIAREPQNAAIIANFASVFERMGDLDAVQHWAEHARDADPAYPDSYNLLANVAMERGAYQDAERLYQHVLTLDATNRNANWNMALLWLLHGDFVRGWPQFEWRKRLQSVVTDHGDYGPNEWTGEPLDGRCILLHTEQGIGDAIQFIRYAPHLKAHGAARVVIEAPYPIAPLLAAAHGVDAVVARGTPLPPFDVHASLMSLPWLLGTTLETVPADVPYLGSEPRAVTSLIGSEPGERRIGIVWAGNPVHARDYLRSAPLDAFERLTSLAGTRFYSLQKGEAPELALRALGTDRIVDLAPHLDDFRDTAAAIQALDLVITVDTSVAHLAGALGVPTWLLLPYVPDFRWMLNRADTPWYPGMRLFRQAAPRDWDSVFREVTAALVHAPPRRAAPAPRDSHPSGDIVTLSSATRTQDGRPRFDVWVPLAELARADLFAEYEAELTGAGAHLATRAFLRDLLRPGDHLIDACPGLGLVTVESSVAPAPPAAIHVVGDADTGARLHALVARRAPSVACHAHLTLGSALACAQGARSIARLGAASDADLAAALLAHAPAPDVLVWDGLVPARSAALAALTARDYQHLALSIVDGEPTLDPVDVLDLAQPIVSLSRAVLSALTGETGATVPGTGRVLGIDWEIRSDTGWGVYGINLAIELLRAGDVTPVVHAVGPMDVSPLVAARLSPLTRRGAGPAPSLMLRALGNGLEHGPGWDAIGARRNVGMIFFEDTALDALAVARATALDLIVAGSAWNTQVLRDHGIAHVATVPQGIDPSIFHPAPRTGMFGDRFVVFSGGKLEYRKGQDLVIAAFRQFVQRHPEALLVVAWHNAWPALISDLDLAGHVSGIPALAGGQLDLVPWLVHNGVPATSVIDVGRQPNALMGQIVREADVALFPNRCEGGTNLVAMECMAAGVPTIVSANTGHLDLVSTGGCRPLTHQSAPASPTRFFRGIDGWGESAVDEMLHALEHAITDRVSRQDLGRRGAAAMAQWTWHHQVTQLRAVLAPLW